jgi:hypothetical protein
MQWRARCGRSAWKWRPRRCRPMAPFRRRAWRTGEPQTLNMLVWVGSTDAPDPAEERTAASWLDSRSDASAVAIVPAGVNPRFRRAGVSAQPPARLVDRKSRKWPHSMSSRQRRSPRPSGGSSSRTATPTAGARPRGPSAAVRGALLGVPRAALAPAARVAALDVSAQRSRDVHLSRGRGGS